MVVAINTIDSRKRIASALNPTRYFSLLSVLLLCLITYANTKINFNKGTLISQLLVFIGLAGLWFYIVGLSLKSAVFASVALIPSFFTELGAFNLNVIALSLSDFFTIFTLLVFIVRPQSLRLIRFTSFLWSLVVVSCLSIGFADNPMVHMGILIRLVVLVAILTVILSCPGDFLKKPVLLAILIWPLVMLSHLAGQDCLWSFLSFGEGQVGNIDESTKPVLGSHSFVRYLLFTLPLFIFLKCPKWINIGLLLYLLTMVVMSQSRSLVLGIGVGLFFYIRFVHENKAFSVKKWFVLLTIIGGIVIGVASIGFFNYQTDEGSKAYSSYIRVSKIAASLQTYFDNPLLGVGYGAASAIDSKVVDTLRGSDYGYLDKVIDVKASAESTPPQILAETGTLGALTTFIILLLAYRHSIKVLQDSAIADYAKIALLILIVIFVTDFLGSNSYGAFPFYMAMPFVFGGIRWKR